MKPTNQFLKDAFGWGAFLWAIGYLLGIILFMTVRTQMIGWIIAPIGTVITLWVLIKKIRAYYFPYYLLLGIVWTVIAIALDYLLIVRTFKPADGYYKPDVYLYYALTLLLPVVVGAIRAGKEEKTNDPGPTSLPA